MAKQRRRENPPKPSDVYVGSWWKHRFPDEQHPAKPRRVSAVFEKDGKVRVHLAYADGRRSHKAVLLRTLLKQHDPCEAPLPPSEPKQKNPRPVFDAQLGLEEVQIRGIIREELERASEKIVHDVAALLTAIK
jgi:hypothetical protein